jgi:uncharacterized membrane protein YphA (DoxX/SURF4 family)
MFHHALSLGLLWRGGVTLLRLALGAVFIWTGLAKLQQPYDFLGAVYNYELVGPQTGWWIAAILPWLEVAVGASLVLGVWQQGGAFLAVVLFGVFTVAHASAAGEGLKIPCGCGAAGSAPQFTSYWKVVESGLMLLAAGLVFVGSLTWSSRHESGSTEGTA